MGKTAMVWGKDEGAWAEGIIAQDAKSAAAVTGIRYRKRKDIHPPTF